MPTDPVREANVKSFHRLVSVLQRVLKVDRTRITMSTKLGTLGVDDSTSIKLMDALQKEFGLEFPAKLFLPTASVNDIVTYTAMHVYNVDTSGTAPVDESSGPISPAYLEKLEKAKKQHSDDGETKPQASTPPTRPADSPVAPGPASNQNPIKPGPGKTETK